jgi:hypothetical protein
MVIADWALKISGFSEYGLIDGRTSNTALEWYYCAICLAISLVGFGVGTWHYLRRVEP